MKLIVGLGNPGKEYQGTRHNIGFTVLDELVQEFQASSFKLQEKFKADISEWRVGSEKVLLAKPSTFMNLSGDAVQAIKSFYKLEDADILIIQDEMDYAPGTFAFAIGSGAAGHNGIFSVQERLATKDIARMRIGIGRPKIGTKEDFVLTRFNEEETPIMKEVVENACKASRDWASKGLTKTMNVWNAVKSGPAA